MSDMNKEDFAPESKPRPVTKIDLGDICPFRALTKNLARCEVDLTGIADAKNSKAMLRLASTRIEADKERICLVWRSMRTKKGVKTPVFNLVYAYSPDVNDVLKETGQATFSMTEKLWHIPQSLLDDNIAEQLRDEYFSVIVDLDDKVAYATGIAPRSGKETRYYDLLPRPVTIHMEDLTDAMREERPGDHFTGRYDRVFNGQEFIAPEGGAFSTRHAFLLVRMPVCGGKLRYGVISSLTGTVEHVLFGSGASAAISRFHDSFAALKEPVILPVSGSRHETLMTVADDLRKMMRPALAEADALRTILPDLNVSLIPLEYAEVMHGEGMRSEVHGKVRVRRDPMMAEIAALTGQDGARDVIIPITPDQGRTTKDVRVTILHEVAHHLTFEDKNLDEKESHGNAFAVAFAVLAILSRTLTEDETTDHLAPYYGKEVARVWAETGTIASNSLRSRGWVSCADVRNFVAMGMVRSRESISAPSETV